ncbi:MAG: selenide, water dikinase SelD [Bacteroidota bacterium]|nr:selenide, water dikinase SelD [Bacteroidota bacterium]
MENLDIRLTQFSHGAGCGCKISPAILDEILKSEKQRSFPNLLVGYDHKDDAAVLDLGNGTALISTTDFFMPIVDDAYTFGQIAAVNAISDVYAMGGRPVMAIAILAWPVDKIPPSVASKVMEGARNICAKAGIPLAGGHSIDAPEPIFGLSVNGIIDKAHIKQNSGAKAGDLLYLTKGLGVGIFTTAEKKGILKSAHRDFAINSMLKLNDIGLILGVNDEVHAMTDVTGFGLAGHLLELVEASQVDAVINYVNLPILDESVLEYISMGSIPGGTYRNWKSYGHKMNITDEQQIAILADPQTSGGLLIAVDPKFKDQLEQLLISQELNSKQIGVLVARSLASHRVTFQ